MILYVIPIELARFQVDNGNTSGFAKERLWDLNIHFGYLWAPPCGGIDFIILAFDSVLIQVNNKDFLRLMKV